MNRIIYYLVFFTIYVCTLSVHAQQNDIFEDNIVTAYENAFTLNEKKDYLQAYRQIIKAEQALDATLRQHQLAASRLNDYEFLNVFWPIKKSRAEIAYMLGLHTDMKVISDTLSRALEQKQREADDKAIFNNRTSVLRADLAKLDGGHFFLTEQYDSAENALQKALQLSPKFGRDDFVCKVHDDLAQLYYKQEKYEKALAQLDSILANPLYSDNATRQKETETNILLVKSQRALCLARLGQFELALQEMNPIIATYKRQGNKRLYAEAIRKKAKVLMLQYDATGIYNPLAKTCYQDYLTVSKKYVDEHFVHMNESEREQYWMAEQPFVTDCFRLEDKAPELLYNVALYSKAVLLQMGRELKEEMSLAKRKKTLASIRVTWQQVREKLPQGGCAIEFVVYERMGKKHLGALVLLKKSNRPQFVNIANVEDLANHLVASRWMVKDILADTQETDKINALYNDSALQKIVWTVPLVTALEDCTEIYFSPDGIFHQMGIEYMTPPSMNGKIFHRLTTTRMLLQRGKNVCTDKMLMCGGVDYKQSIYDAQIGNDELAYSRLAKMNLSVPPLPGTAMEIDSIKAIREQHLNDNILRADSVTERVLNELMGKYNIFHISTHGLFMGVANIGTDIHPSQTDQQLSNSVLYLSGSETNLNRPSFDATYQDGLLSARELAKMDLSQVNLTVMSACMSGLGYITPDGVYGLLRGFKSAGVKTIISTLWSVNDAATCLFMTRFYQYLEAGKEIHEAFQMARTYLQQHETTYGSSANGSYVQSRRFSVRRFNQPYYYNAFILIDGI